MRIRRLIALAAILSLAPLGAEASPYPAARLPMFSWAWLRAPFAWLAHSEPATPPPCDGPTCFELRSARGFQVLTCDAPDFGTGLYVDLGGRVQFRTAENVFEGGEVDRLDLQYAIRSDGIFELRDFGRERIVKSVLLVARAASREATVRLRFGRTVE